MVRLIIDVVMACGRNDGSSWPRNLTGTNCDGSLRTRLRYAVGGWKLLGCNSLKFRHVVT